MQSPNNEQIKAEAVTAEQNGNKVEQTDQSKEKEGIEQEGSIKNTK